MMQLKLEFKDGDKFYFRLLDDQYGGDWWTGTEWKIDEFFDVKTCVDNYSNLRKEIRNLSSKYNVELELRGASMSLWHVVKPGETYIPTRKLKPFSFKASQFFAYAALVINCLLSGVVITLVSSAFRSGAPLSQYLGITVFNVIAFGFCYTLFWVNHRHSKLYGWTA